MDSSASLPYQVLINGELYGAARDSRGAEAMMRNFLDEGPGEWVPKTHEDPLRIQILGPHGISNFHKPEPGPSLAQVAEIQAQLLERDAVQAEKRAAIEAKRLREDANQIRKDGRPGWLGGNELEAWRLASSGQPVPPLPEPLALPSMLRLSRDDQPADTA